MSRIFRGTGLPTAVRKNQPLVPRSNLGGKVCARTDPWFRGQTLLVPGHGGGDDDMPAKVAGHALNFPTPSPPPQKGGTNQEINPLFSSHVCIFVITFLLWAWVWVVDQVGSQDDLLA